MTDSDPGCVKTHTSAKCRKHNSPARHRTSRVQYNLTLRDAIDQRYFYVWRERRSFRTAKTHLRHRRAIFAVMHSGVRVQRCGNVRPLSLRTGLHEATRVQSPGALMPGTAISGLVCTTFLVLLGFPAVPQEPAGKGADTESGQQTFNNACRTCHTTKEGDNRLGPNLHNIIGRKAGSLQNYGYSSAMKGADFVWDKEKLDRFIAKPDEVVPGNNMKPYGGLTSDGEPVKWIVLLWSPTPN